VLVYQLQQAKLRSDIVHRLEDLWVLICVNTVTCSLEVLRYLKALQVIQICK
jgi:hypothetical protein